MFRSAARSSFRSSRQAVARRTYVTGHHTSAMPQKSDMPWVIGSALVFLPLFFSLTSPPGVHAQTHATSPMKEGLHEDVPAARKATQAEEPAEKEPSPSAAADKAESEGKSTESESKPQEAAVATSTTRHDAKDVGEAAKESQQNVQASGDEQRAGTEEARAAVEEKKDEKKDEESTEKKEEKKDDSE